MEKFRNILDKVFIIMMILAVLALIIAGLGGAIPININPSEQIVKFDLAYMGWKVTDPTMGTLKIDHNEKSQGWGSLEYTYNVKSSARPSFYCDNVVIESIMQMSFFMKAKKPCVYSLQIKRKSNDKIMQKSFKVGTKWKEYKITQDDLKVAMRIKGKIPQNDFKKWIRFVDANPRYKSNTVWFDHFKIIRW